jgi:hypothetical protein
VLDVSAPVSVSVRVLQDVLGQVAQARSAIRDGDLELGELVLDDVTGSLRRLLERRRPTCDECGAAFRWPGELAEHRRRVHEAAGS